MLQYGDDEIELATIVTSNASVQLLAQQQESARLPKPEDIDDVQALRDALFIFFRLPTIAGLEEDEQMEMMKEKYPMVDGMMDAFEQEEIQEMADLTTKLEKRHIHDTRLRYLPVDEADYRLQPVSLDSLNKYDQVMKEQEEEMCQGCGLPLDADSPDSQYWKAYRCENTQYEAIFHNRMCVKLRQAKESIRDRVAELDPTKDPLKIHFHQDLGLDEKYRPTRCLTTWDEQYEEEFRPAELREYRKTVNNVLYRNLDIGERFDAVPEELKYLDFREFGVPLWLFMVYQLKIREFRGFWPILSFITLYIDTPEAIELMEEHSRLLMPFHSLTGKDNHFVDYLMTIPEAAIYPIATALYIAAFIREEGEKHWDEDVTENVAMHFVKMALKLLGQIGSDHLAAIMLEMPTNLDGLSAFDIAVANNMSIFVQDPRISAYAVSMWNERKPIHPGKHFGVEITVADQFKRISTHPAKFYFSPSGFRLIQLALFACHILVFFQVTFNLRYNYEKGVETSEYWLWFFNLGNVLFLMYSLFINFKVYMQQFKAVFEIAMGCLWIIIFFQRFFLKADPRCETYKSDGETCKTVNGPSTRNSGAVQTYMLCWGIQCILFPLILMFQFRRLRNVGPMIRVLTLMLKDIANFVGIVFLIFVSVSLSLLYIIAHDLPEQDLDSFSGVSEYALQSVLGAQDWEAVKSTDDFAVNRSNMAEVLVMFCTVLGTIIVLNLLIAVLSGAYGLVRELSEREVNFIRVNESYTASRTGAFIPTPLTVFAFMVMGIWFLVDLCVSTATKRRRVLNDWKFSPLNRKVVRPGDDVEYEQIELKEGTQDYVDVVRRGYVQKLDCSELAVIKFKAEEIRVRKNKIKKIYGEWTTERSRQDDTALCNTRERFYCKYCRFQFLSEHVGTVAHLQSLFALYGKVLDHSDMGRLSNQMGDHLPGGNPDKKTYNVGQLCPECYRPFIALPDHSDEIGRLTFLGEIASFWVFIFTLWLPMTALMSLPAVFAFLARSIYGGDSKDQSQALQIRRERKKVALVEPNDQYRKRVHGIFAEELAYDERIVKIRKQVEKVKQKMNETQDFGIHAIEAKARRKVSRYYGWLNPTERRDRKRKLDRLHRDLSEVMSVLSKMVQERQEKIDKLVAEETQRNNGLTVGVAEFVRRVSMREEDDVF